VIYFGLYSYPARVRPWRLLTVAVASMPLSVVLVFGYYGLTHPRQLTVAALAHLGYTSSRSAQIIQGVDWLEVLLAETQFDRSPLMGKMVDLQVVPILTYLIDAIRRVAVFSLVSVGGLIAWRFLFWTTPGGAMFRRAGAALRRVWSAAKQARTMLIQWRQYVPEGRDNTKSLLAIVVAKGIRYLDPTEIVAPAFVLLLAASAYLLTFGERASAESFANLAFVMLVVAVAGRLWKAFRNRSSQ
jgi:hypothetical protein